METRNDRQERREYFAYQPGDLSIADTLCEACAFRLREDPSCCRKYPDGKPIEMLDPDWFCPDFTVVELGKD